MANDDLEARKEAVRREHAKHKGLANMTNDIHESSQPTPTQDELNMINAGIPLDEKEDVSAPAFPTLEEQRRNLQSDDATGTYSNRAVTPRRRGRPARTETP